MSTESGQILILDSETRNVVATHTSHAMCVRTLSWSGDSQVSAPASLYISAWDSSDAAAYDPAQYLFSGSDDRRIVLHDVRAGSAGSAGRGSAAVAELKGHASWVLSLGASPDGRALVSG
jgi:WD repeat-containing protein 61